jgi:hypothetical protein
MLLQGVVRTRIQKTTLPVTASLKAINLSARLETLRILPISPCDVLMLLRSFASCQQSRHS